MLALMLAITATQPPSDRKKLVDIGSHSTLTRYVAAQHECGFHDAKIEISADGREYVAKTEPASGADTQEAYACIMVWVMDHDSDAPIHVIDAPSK